MKATFKLERQRYDVRAITLAHQKEPHFLSCSRDGKLIMRRDERGDYLLLAHDQKTVVEMSATDARDFAVWVLMANATQSQAATLCGPRLSGSDTHNP